MGIAAQSLKTMSFDLKIPGNKTPLQLWRPDGTLFPEGLELLPWTCRAQVQSGSLLLGCLTGAVNEACPRVSERLSSPNRTQDQAIGSMVLLSLRLPRLSYPPLMAGICVICE